MVALSPNVRGLPILLQGDIIWPSIRLSPNLFEYRLR